jgi:hypothetical protein
LATVCRRRSPACPGPSSVPNTGTELVPRALEAVEVGPSGRQRGGGQHPHRHGVSPDPRPELRITEIRAPSHRKQIPFDQAVGPLASQGREDVVVGSARGERAVDRQRVAGPEEVVEPPLGATSFRSRRAARCVALPAFRVDRVHQTPHFGQ